MPSFYLLQKSSSFQISIVLASDIVKVRCNFYPVLFSDTAISDEQFLNNRTTYKRSSFVFPGLDQVTQLVNGPYSVCVCKQGYGDRMTKT